MIEVRNIKKSYKVLQRKKGHYLQNLFFPKYKIVEAVKDISFHIDDGESVGYIGLNGAGKSTTLKMISGILTADEGKIIIDEQEPSENRREVCKQLGIVFGNKTNLWWDLPARACFDVLKNMYEVDEKQFNELIKTYEELLGINEYYNTPLRQLSLGQRTTIEICASLLHRPKILLLDEPTIGLDIISREKILKFVKYINKEFKTTIILTSHNMLDIEEVCKRVIVIDRGKVIFDGDISELKRYHSENKIIIKCSNESEEEHKLITELGFINIKDKSNPKVNVYSKNTDNSNKNMMNIMNILKSISCIMAFEVKEIPFDEVIRKLYTQKEKVI